MWLSDQGVRATVNYQLRAGLALSLMVQVLAAAFEARAASRRCSCASRNAAEILSVKSVIDWRFRLLQAQGLMLPRGGLQICELAKHKQPAAPGQVAKMLRSADCDISISKLHQLQPTEHEQGSVRA